MAYKLSQLNIHDPHHANKTGEILVQKAEDETGSDLFILLEIDSNQPEDTAFIQSFLELAYSAYEQSELLEAEKTLENILQTINANLSEIVPKSYNWLNKLHCFVGIVNGSDIHFSIFGKIKSFIIKNALIKDVVSKQPKPNFDEPFDSIISGRLNQNDRLLITTESLTDYLSLEKIKKTVSALPPQSSMAHLGNILESVPSNVSFFSIIIQSTGIASIQEEPAAKPAGRLSSTTGSKNSLDQLLKTQKETEKILTQPSLIESLKEKIKKQVSAKSQINKKEVPRPVKKTASQPKAKAKRNKNKTAGQIKQAANILVMVFKKILNITKNIWDFLTEQRARNMFVSGIAKKLTVLINKFNRLKKIHKTLILLSVILVLLFSQNLIWQEKKMESLRQTEEYNNKLTQIADKKNAIEASLIYNDTVRAKQLLKEINDIMFSLPQNSKNQIAEYQKIEKDYNEFFSKVWKVVNVANPLSLFNFREINLTTNVSHLGLAANVIYGFNDTDQVYTINTQNEEVIVLDKFNLTAQAATYSDKLNSLVVVTENNDFYKVNLNQIEKLPVALPDSLVKIDDLKFYLDKMYILDSGSKQIYRLTFDGVGYSSARSWITEDLPIDQSSALAIDGYIYTLQQNGEILKLSRGAKQEFSEITIEPKFNSPIKISTTEEGQYIYILDPNNQRLIVISKDGELKKQYYSDQFNNLKDMVIEESAQKAYLLNGSQIYIIAINNI